MDSCYKMASQIPPEKLMTTSNTSILNNERISKSRSAYNTAWVESHRKLREGRADREYN